MARIGLGPTTGIPTKQRRPQKRVPVSRSPVFGPLKSPQQAVRQTQRQAASRADRARRPVIRRATVPYAPKLAHPTSHQRSAAVQIVGRGLKRQGVTSREVQQIREGQGTRQQRIRINRYLGGYGTMVRGQRPGVGNYPARSGPAPTRLSLFPGASINLTQLQRGVGARLAGNPLAAFASGISQIASVRPFSDRGVIGRSANDLLTFPAAAIPTAYNVIHAGITRGPVAGARTVIDPVVQSIEHPVDAFKQHPLFTALLAHGAISAAGRTVGAVGRAGGAGFASTSRSPLGIAGESGARIQVPRRYSKSVFHKAGQVAYDRRLQPVRDRQGQPVRDARGRVVLAAPAGGTFNRVERLLNKRGDFVSSAANAVERNSRATVARDVAGLEPTRIQNGRLAAVERRVTGGMTRPERDLVAMAVEGTIRPRTVIQDLRKERARLEDAYRAGGLDPVERHTNRIRARTIDRVLASKGAQRSLPNVFQSAKLLASGGNKLSATAVAQRMLDPAAAERAKLFPYAQSHMGAKPVEHADGTVTLRGSGGQFLANDAIRAHMRANGINPDHIAYLPHRPDVRGARAFHQQFRLQRRNLDQESRTGQAYAKGATSNEYDAIVEHLTRQSGLITNAREFDRLIQQAGVKHPSGKYFTWKEAQQYAKHAGRAPGEATGKLLPGEADLVPVRAFPAKYDEERAQAIQNEQNPGEAGAGARLVEEQNARLTRPDPRDPNARNVVLVPQTLADRLQENLQRTRKGDRPLQAVNNAFRTTVLPFSAKWLTGNVLEAVGRLATVGVTPRDVGIGRRLISELRAIDEHAAEQVHAHLVGGLLYGERGLTNRRGSAAFGRAGVVGHLPVVRELGATIRGITQPIFRLNRAFEQGAQYAALGKYARREIQDFTGSWTKAVRVQRQALQDVAKGLTDTGAQHDAARYLDETLGQYSRFSPGMRHVIQTYAPFLPWYLNSLRFVLWTLPAHHPIKTAALTQAEAAFEQDWRDQHKTVKGVAPDLMTAIPAGQGFVDVARYTPFGFPGPLATGDLGSLSGIVLPQVSGIELAALGKDPFGGDLRVPKTATNHGKPSGGQKAAIAVNQAAEAFIPGLSLVRRLRERGGTGYANSTALSPKVRPPKPGVPRVSGADRAFNPFRPVFLAPKPGAPSSPQERRLQQAADRITARLNSGAGGDQDKRLQQAADRILARQAK